jgi:cysteine synthase A
VNICEDITKAIGQTPLVRLNRISEGLNAEVLLKMESSNPLSSVKDRIALAMIESAERDGLLDSDTIIVEPTSGNTGIALSYIAAAKGYKLILTMPESMSVERRRIMSILGAELVLTPADKGMGGAISKAKEIYDQQAKAFMPQQFDNPANPGIHSSTTGPEIDAATDGTLDAFVAGVGTGGTLSGVSRYFKDKKADFKSIAVEPIGSPVISGGNPGPHKIQGIGAGFIPENLDTSLVDDVIKVSEADAQVMAKRLAREEGIFCGISAAANVWAAVEYAKRPENAGKRIATVICDTGERYLSTWLFEE